MMKENRNVALISWLSAIAVTFIALFSFAISYVAQRELAVAAGIHPWLTYIFPLVIDGFIVVASLSVLRNSLVGESSKYQWAMVGLFTVLSVAFNAAHAHNVLLQMTFSGIPVTLVPHVTMPVALFFGFEMLMRQIHNAIARSGAIQSLASLKAELEQKQAELDTELDLRRNELDRLAQKASELEAEIAHKATQVSELEQETSQLQKARRDANQATSSAKVQKFIPGDQDLLDKANETRALTMQQRRHEIRDMLQAGLTVGDLANHFQVGVKTIQRDIAALDIPLIGRGRNARMKSHLETSTFVPSGNGTGNVSLQKVMG